MKQVYSNHQPTGLTRAFRKLLILFLTILYCVPLDIHAQPSRSIYGIANQINDFYPVSAEAATLFTKIPEEMDYCRGRATFRIPLYEIKTPSFTLPISLVYITGGIKVGEVTGAVGLGWRLEAEPMITREIRGLPDNYSLMRDSSYMQQYLSDFLVNVGRGDRDLLNDLFYYRTLQSSGQFFLRRADNLNFRPSLLSHEPVKLSVTGGRITDAFQNGINLVDPQGTLYVFGNTPNARERTSGSGISAECTSWKASSIQSVNGEIMKFSYKEDFMTEQHVSQYDYYAVEDKSDSSTPPQNSNIPPSPGYWKGVSGVAKYYNPSGSLANMPDRYYPTGNSYVNTRRIEEIEFLNGRVEFQYSNQTKTVQRILVRDLNGALIKEIAFESTLREYDRVLLNRIRMKGPGDTTFQKYEFSYRIPSSTDYSPYTKGIDLWGYYNGYDGNTDLIQRQTVPIYDNNNVTIKNVQIGGASNRKPSLGSTLFYALDRITYPTGGYTDIIYAQNKWLYESGQPTPAGGARIAALRESNIDGTTIYRRFEYQVFSTKWDAGFLRYPMTLWAFKQKMKKLYAYEYKSAADFQTIQKDYTLYLGQNIYTTDNDVYYETVDEFIGDTKIKHSYEKAFNYFNPGYLKDEKNATRYNDPANQGNYIVDNKVRYTKNGDALRIESSNHVSHNAYLTKMDCAIVIENFCGTTNTERMRDYYMDSFRERNYNMNITENRLSSSLVTDSLPERSINEKTKYHYDRNKQLTAIERTTPEGDVYKTEYNYSFDYRTTPYTTMVSKNNLSTPIEERQYKNEELKKTVRYPYRADVTVKSGYCLDKITENRNDANTEFRNVETYDAYLSCGQPLQITRKDGTKVSFLWAYGGQYVIAIAENLTIQEIRQQTGLDPEAVVKGTVDPWSARSKMEALRKSCPQAHIMVYDYTPLVGISKQSAPNGINEYNSYDAYGRLKEVKDTDDKVVKSYEYNLINPTY